MRRFPYGMLFIPDLLAYWLCGVQAVERTIASTSQLLDAGTGDWATDKANGDYASVAFSRIELSRSVEEERH